jgi:CHAD domain-containing protein
MSPTKAAMRRSLKDAIKQFRILEQLLLSGDIDDRLLRDFRVALNRVRTTAWGVQQYVDQKELGEDPADVLTALAAARIRAAYDLCKVISSDLKRPEIDFQAGSLIEFQEVVQALGADLSAVVKKRR